MAHPTKHPPGELAVSVAEAALLLGTSNSKIRSLIGQGELKAFRLGKSGDLRIKRQTITQYMELREVKVKRA